MPKPWEHYAQLQPAPEPGPGATAGNAASLAQGVAPTSIPPSLPYDLHALAGSMPMPANAVPQLPYDLRALAGAGARPTATATGHNCTLVAPTGRYHAADGVALFQPNMAAAVTNGIRALNNAHIVPVITDGYRTAQMQEQRRAANRSGRLRNGAARGVSGHQVGLSVDFGPRSNAGNNDAIRAAMTQAGLANGAHFSPTDPLHYMMPNTRRRQTAALAQACAAAYRGR